MRRDAALCQGPDDAHLGTASTPTGGWSRQSAPPGRQDPGDGRPVPPHPSVPESCTRHGERGKDANSEREWDTLERQPALSLLHPLASGRL